MDDEHERPCDNKMDPKRHIRSLIRYKYLKILDQLRIYLFVSKSSRVVTFKYNAYTRHATGIEPVTDTGEITQILCAGKETTLTECTTQLKELLKTRESFHHNEEIPPEYCESQNTEFKHYYYDDMEKKDLDFNASHLKSRLDRDKELLANVSAFANTDGGSLILGVKESGKNPVIRGFQTTHNHKQEEMALESYLENTLCRCIWSGNSDDLPVRGKDWDVFYHEVSQPSGKLSQVIEIRVPKHSKGMFLNPPVYFVVSDSGQRAELTDFQEWVKKFCPPSLSATREDKCNRL